MLDRSLRTVEWEWGRAKAYPRRLFEEDGQGLAGAGEGSAPEVEEDHRAVGWTQPPARGGITRGHQTGGDAT